MGLKSDAIALNTYDEIPYNSYPFYFTCPDYLRTIGILFGMEPPVPETARILELGCASANNLLNFAETYPNSYSLGVDLSQVEIAHGQKVIAELGLTNIQLKHLSITDIDESFGKFDYIISHGVLSWVPVNVQEKIFEISKKLLTPNGIAFISYNTLPAWNMVKTVREMMMFHASIFPSAVDKLNQAKLFLKFINEALEGSQDPYTKFLREETEHISKQEDPYILHEYVEGENHPMYFYQFMNKANSYKLNYLGEAFYSLMHIGNLPDKAAVKLQEIKNLDTLEQYKDFVNHTRFRNTLLCHDNIVLNRTIETDAISKFYSVCTILPEFKEQDVDIANPAELIKFYFNGSRQVYISTASPRIKAVFYVYFENIGNPLTTNQLFKLAAQKIPGAEQDFAAEFLQYSNRLIFNGYLNLFATKPNSVFTISQKPRASKLAQYQAKSASLNKIWVTNQINALVPLQIAEKYVMELLTGEMDILALKEKIFEKLVIKELVVQEDGNNITDKKRLQDIADKCVDEVLEKFRTNYLLVD